MKIEIKLFASLRKYLPKGDSPTDTCLKVPDNATVAQVIKTLKIPPEAAKLFFINNVKAQLDQHLRDGDRLGIFPPVAGG